MIYDVQLLLQLPVVLACLDVLWLYRTLNHGFIVARIWLAHILLRLDHIHNVDILVCALTVRHWLLPTDIALRRSLLLHHRLVRLSLTLLARSSSTFLLIEIRLVLHYMYDLLLLALKKFIDLALAMLLDGVVFLVCSIGGLGRVTRVVLGAAPSYLDPGLRSVATSARSSHLSSVPFALLLHVLTLNVLELNRIFLRGLTVIQEVVEVWVSSLLHFLPVHVITASSLLLVLLHGLVALLLVRVLSLVRWVLLEVFRLPLLGGGFVVHLLEGVVPSIVSVFIPGFTLTMGTSLRVGRLLLAMVRPLLLLLWLLLEVLGRLLVELHLFVASAFEFFLQLRVVVVVPLRLFDLFRTRRINEVVSLHLVRDVLVVDAAEHLLHALGLLRVLRLLSC